MFWAIVRMEVHPLVLFVEVYFESDPYVLFLQPFSFVFLCLEGQSRQRYNSARVGQLRVKQVGQLTVKWVGQNGVK